MYFKDYKVLTDWIRFGKVLTRTALEYSGLAS
jgi:hypothetical protein